MGDRDAKVESDDCPGGKLRESYYKELNTLLLKEQAPKYRVEHSETCGKSVETTDSCNVNSDRDRCGDGSFPYIESFIRLSGPEAGEVFVQRLRCPEDAELGIPDSERIQEIQVTPAQFRSFPIKGSRVNSNPKQFSLRNGHVHLWASSETQTFTTRIAETDVEIRAIPIAWRWDYGDGSSRSLNQPGNPMPSHTLHDKTPTSHSYLETGLFNVNLTTFYRGEFRVSGGSWQTIPGQAAVPSEAVPIDVWRTEKELIAGEGE